MTEQTKELVKTFGFLEAQAELERALSANRAALERSKSDLASLVAGRTKYIATHTLDEAQIYEHKIQTARVAVDFVEIALDQKLAAEQMRIAGEIDASRRKAYDITKTAAENMRGLFNEKYTVFASALASLFEAVGQVNADIDGINSALPSGAPAIAMIDDAVTTIRDHARLPGIGGSGPIWRGYKFDRNVTV